MSKFFRALENAEKERAAEAPAAPGRPEPAAPSAAATVPRPKATAGVADETGAKRAPSSNGAADGAAPGGRPEPPAGRPEPPVTPTYGAPLVRRRRGEGAHAGALVDDLAPAHVEDAAQLDDHLVSLLAPTSFAAEQYRTARLAIETLRRERGLHVVAVSSPGRAEGKSVTAINIAGALAQAPDARVVLVDADLRHPRLASYLGLPPTRGLSAYLLDESLDTGDVVQRSAAAAFSVIVAGPPSSMPYELLKSPRFTALFQALRTRFDYVVVDTPPVLLFPDVGILRDAVDGFLLVVRANHTPREGVVDGLDTVGRHRVVGLIFNDDSRNVAATSDPEPDTGWRRYFSFRLAGGLVD
jgi:protein-tyrosine kinase